jgi:uroporphyrinogen-III synthase
MAKYKVLSTKKLEPALVEAAQRENMVITEQEFISVRPIETKEKAKEILDIISSGKAGYVVFTSANAVTPFEKYFHQQDTFYVVDWKIFCLAGATRDAIMHSHLIEKNIVDTAASAAALAEKIIAHHIPEIVFFCGDKRRDELPAALRKAGITVHEVVVYETIDTPEITTDDMDGILFFSPSAVRSFFSVNQLKPHTVCFAIGQTTADAIADVTDNKIIISEAPSQEMILAAVQFYFKNINCYE